MSSPGRRSSRGGGAPGSPIFVPLDLFARGQHVNRIQAVEHDRVFIGLRFFVLIRKSLGMRSVMDAARMERAHSGANIIAAEEIAVVIENELVVIGVAMVERNAKGVGILLERTRHEATYHG